MQIFNKHWFKFIIILFYFGVVYFLLRAYHIEYSKIKDINPHFIRENIKALGIWIPLVYVVFYILRPLILFPATILSILGGVIFGYFWGIILVLLGAMFSAVIEFFLSRYYGRKLVMRLVRDANLLFLDKAVQKHGFKTVLLIRLVPNVAFDIQNFSLGITSIKFKDYFLATFLGIIPISSVYVYLGRSFIDLRYMGKIFLILLILVGIYFIQLYLKKIYKK